MTVLARLLLCTSLLFATLAHAARPPTILFVLAALEKKGLRQDALVVFTSDNGGPLSAEITSGTGNPATLAALPNVVDVFPASFQIMPGTAAAKP